jgi:hypothetical protein
VTLRDPLFFLKEGPQLVPDPRILAISVYSVRVG